MKLVRLISNFGYSFMPKEKGVKVKKEKVSNIKIEISPILGINSELPPMFITCDYKEIFTKIKKLLPI